jgi:hypothetical protein
MTAELLISVRHLLIKDRSEFLLPTFTISNDKNQLSQFLSNPEVIEAVGSSELKLPYYDGAFIYAQFPLKNHTTLLLNSDAFVEKNIMAKMVLEEVNGFLYSLWYIKDCCVSAHSMINKFVNINRSIQSSTQYSFFTLHDGSFSDCYFSIDELSRAKELMDKETVICPTFHKIPSIEEVKSRNEISDGISTMRLIDFDYSKLTRIERASILLHTARTYHFLPMRISFFIPFFECLFIASAGGEAQQKVCERIAFYLYSDKMERANAYGAIKDGYDIRSKFLHGDKLPSKFNAELLPSISKKIDDIARKLFVKILEGDHAIFLQNQSNFEVWLSQLIFM